MGSVFLGVNRNKRSVVLDLKEARGRARFLELARSADYVSNDHDVANERRGYQGISIPAAKTPFRGAHSRLRPPA